MQCGSGVLAALDFDHDEGEEQEKHGHAETDPVHGLVANQHITVHVTLHTGNRGPHPTLTETWNLQQEHKTTGVKTTRGADTTHDPPGPSALTC